MTSPSEPPDSDWTEDEATRMIGKLGYVPPEARGGGSDDFDPNRVSAGDREKFRKRKRAKKTPIWMKLATGAVVIVVVAALGGGIWWLASGSAEDEDGSGPTYEAVDKPCDLLDESPFEPVTDGAKSNVRKDETEKRAHSQRQMCEVAFGDAGEIGDITIHTQVFKSEAGAKNELEFAADDAESNAETNPDTQQFEKVSGAGKGAFSVTRQPSAESKTIDYSVHYFSDNVYIMARVGIYNGKASADQAAQYAKDLGDKYLENWREA